MKFELRLEPGGHTRQYALWKAGPLVEVVASALPCWELGSTPTKPTMHGRGLLDTGSDKSMVKTTVLDALGIQPLNGEPRTTGAGQVTIRRYGGICLQFSETQFPLFPLDEVLSAPMENDPWFVVIGRDVLQHLRIEYDGVTGRVLLFHGEDAGQNGKPEE